MKASHPEIAKRMPHEALNVILNTLDAYIANHKDVFDVLDKAAYTDLFHGRLSEYEYMNPQCVLNPAYGFAVNVIDVL